MVYWGQLRVDKRKLGANSDLLNLSSGQIGEFRLITSYDFLWARRVILGNVRTDSNLT